MKSYNRIMELFWLSMTIIILIVVTVMCFLEETERWWQFYFLAFFSGGMWFLRRWVRKRLEKKNRPAPGSQAEK